MASITAVTTHALSTDRWKLVLMIAAAIGWAVFLYVTWFAITRGWQLTKGHVRLVDWHVFDAGARQLADRTLYRVPLDVEGLPLSASQFRLPPLSAAWALPLAWMPVETAGMIWQVTAAASVALATWLGLTICSVRWQWLWTGVILGPMSPTVLYLEGLHLGTNNYLVLALVAAFGWAYFRGHRRAAGILLGLAIATKLWPAVLLVMAWRERQWAVIGWAAGVVVLQGVVILAWLGPDVVGPILATIAEPIPPTGFLLGPSAVSGLREVWNAGLGLAFGVVLLLVPARGRLGFGLALVAAMAVIGNLWVHYAPTLLFAVGLIIASVAARYGPPQRTMVAPTPS